MALKEQRQNAWQKRRVLERTKSILRRVKEIQERIQEKIQEKIQEIQESV